MHRRMLACLGVFVTAVAVTSLPGCGTFPQTRAEFTGHPKIAKTTYHVPRALNTVVASLEKQASNCINGTSRQVANAGRSVTNTGYYMSVEKKSATRAEMTYRIVDNVTVGQPQGGFYQMAADLQAASSRSTKVTLYHGASFQKTLINAVRKWTEGDDRSCHGYGGR